MAVTKSLTSAVPYISAGKVYKWEVGMTYVNGVSGDAQYYTSEFTTEVSYDDDTYGFELASESTWNTQAQLLALCPVSHWDNVFDSQVESVFNPVLEPTPDDSYQIPVSE